MWRRINIIEDAVYIYNSIIVNIFFSFQDIFISLEYIFIIHILSKLYNVPVGIPVGTVHPSFEALFAKGLLSLNIKINGLSCS